MASILFVDDDETMRSAIRMTIKGHDLYTASGKEEAVDILNHRPVDLLLTDLYMPNAEDGFSLVREARDIDKSLYIVILTGFGTISSAVNAMKQGADDYITKDLPPDELRMRIDGFLLKHREKIRLERMEAENLLYKRSAFQSSHWIGQSKSFQKVNKRLAAAAADNESTVLILGKSGTGKEMAAREIHKQSRRRDNTFAAIDCPTIPRELFESELFGHEKGAFTDAKTKKLGRIELADNGTLFLDEIADLPLGLQSKLLRFFENSEFYRVGGTKPVRVDTRIISSTNRNLDEMMAEGQFREDLYYRLRVVVIEMPELRERKRDILLLAEHFLQNLNRRKHKNLSFSEEDKQRLTAYDWPGNIRELRNVVESYTVLNELPLPDIIKRNRAERLDFKHAKKRAVQEFEEEFLTRALDSAQGNITRAAARIGISREEFSRKLSRMKSS
jgi:DNA-binding NtrC family response regulator